MAIESQGTKLEISGTAGEGVTSLTPAAGYPTVFTRDTATGLKNGDVVTISGVAGDDAASVNTVWIVRYATEKTFAINLDSTEFTEMGTAGVATPLEWLTLGEMVTFDGPGGTASMYETTHLLSTAKEKKVGLMDEGQLTLSMNWCLETDLGQQEASDARKARSEKNFKLTFSDDSTASFAGYVMGMSASGGVDDKVNGSVTIEITGAVTHSYE